MTHMQTIKEDEYRNGMGNRDDGDGDREDSSSSTDPREILATETGRARAADILQEFELTTAECTCSCPIYCNNNNNDVPSSSAPPPVASTTTVTMSNNGDVVKQKRKSLWSRSQHSRRLKMLVPGKNGDEEEVTLMLAQHERIPMKDFSNEVRATLDVDNFVLQASLLLDVTENTVEAIVDRLLEKLLEGDEREEVIAKEVKSVLFSHDSVHVLAKTIQGTSESLGGGFDYDQSWICALCSVQSLQRRHVAIARLKHAANLGRTSQETRFFCLVMAPMREKGTKNALETARTFATILADIDCRQLLQASKTEDEFKRILNCYAKELAIQQSQSSRHRISRPSVVPFDGFDVGSGCARGLRADLKRRIPHYLSDFRDGIVGHKTLHKLVSTTLFLYFACLLPSIAFGVLNDKNTHGKIDVRKVIVSQTIGGLFFCLFGGQPLIVMLTTAPLAIYIKIIYSICEDFELDFLTMYALVGFWNTLFLCLYSVCDASCLMKWSTRSTEEIFALFISIAFCVDAFKDLANNFKKNYISDGCNQIQQMDMDLLEYLPLNDSNSSNITQMLSIQPCLRENSLVYLILMFGTLWVGVTLHSFTKSPFLDASKREALADYALPVSVVTMSFVGSYLFNDIQLEKFPYQDGDFFRLVSLEEVNIYMIVGSMGLGFCLSLLFFMDQNITGAMVNSPGNKLKKGSAYHLDLLVVAMLNCVLSMFGLPWLHGALPHSPLHVKALADKEERVDQGHVHHIIVRVRETRLTILLSHIMIGLSVFMLPVPLQYIPNAVLYGLFLYMACTALDDNQLFERTMLLITEQAAYPPNHYVRRVPQRKMHIFTFTQLLQLACLCGFGFSPWPYLKMVFPLLIMFFLPIRHRLVPKVIHTKYLDALDRSH
ncbi:sodium bicarbonate transporter-like protein 11 isoform X2 [Acanthaster planci]|uniref:Sodium bicarbonate transporter-like protein 11 isoform X2 n=1 Tax=Acanthaster planci TaxID=133434 RepID=A0A8B7ZS21_ACAPL|nr:sodium bicarbonate transporter-like protein 11 isoform X2 [Acanthaster planci]